jgi:hypothetical protein
MTEQQSVWCGRIRLGIGVAFASLCAASAYAQAPTGAVPVSVLGDQIGKLYPVPSRPGILDPRYDKNRIREKKFALKIRKSQAPETWLRL